MACCSSLRMKRRTPPHVPVMVVLAIVAASLLYYVMRPLVSGEPRRSAPAGTNSGGILGKLRESPWPEKGR